MQLEEFRTVVKTRMALPADDYRSLPAHPLSTIMTAAEKKYGKENHAYQNGDSFYVAMVDTLSIFGSFFGWCDTKGEVTAFGYACHERFRYWYTPDHRAAEQTMAHISTSENDIEEMMANIKNPRDRSKRMVKGILTFCHSVNENVYWHERILRDLYSRSPRIAEMRRDTSTPTKEELSDYLHNILPKDYAWIKNTRPYGHLDDVIKTTNENAMTERDVIKPYDDTVMRAKFKVNRMWNDRSEAGYYDSKTGMSVGDFQKRLSVIGY